MDHTLALFSSSVAIALLIGTAHAETEPIWVEQIVPVAFEIDKAEVLALFAQLPPLTVEVDEDAIIKAIARAIDRDREEETEIIDFASDVYEAEVKPIIAPQAEAFADLLSVTEDGQPSPSALLLYHGLAKRLRNDFEPALIRISGDFTPPSGEDNKLGTWDLDFPSDADHEDPNLIPIFDTDLESRVSAVIDEEITIDLADFGMEKSITISLHSALDLSVELDYKASLVSGNVFEDDSITTVRFRPKYNMTVKREADGGFRTLQITEGDRHSRLQEKKEHPAVHEIQLSAEN